MVECHAGLEIAPYISSAMRRRETLFSTSQKPRTDDDGKGPGRVVGGGEEETSISPPPQLPSTFWSELNWMSTCTRSPSLVPTVPRPHSRRLGSLWAFCLFFFARAFFSLSFSLLSTSDKPLAPRARPTTFFCFRFIRTFRSRVSFSPRPPGLRTVKDRYLRRKREGRKPYGKILF